MTTVDPRTSVPGVQTIADRLRWLIDTRYGGDVQALTRAAGLSYNAVYKVLERDPDRAWSITLRKLARAAGVTLDWLLEGRGGPWVADGTRLDALPGWDDARAQVLALGVAFTPEEWARAAALPVHVPIAHLGPADVLGALQAVHASPLVGPAR